MHECRAVILAVILSSSPLCGQGADPGRPMIPSDLLSIRHYDAIAVSPDGELIAVVVKRPRQAPDTQGHSRNNRQADLGGSSDIWIVRRSNGARHRLTPQDANRWGDGTPLWSPTGAYLAFISADRSGDVFLRIWNRRTGTVRLAIAQSVDLDAGISSVSQHPYDPPIAWIDDHRVAAVVMEKGVRPLDAHITSQTLAARQHGWKLTLDGRVATAVVASSPPDTISSPKEPHAQLLLVDVTSGRVNHVADMPAIQTARARRLVVLSPRGRLAALIVTQRPGQADSIVGWTIRTIWPVRVGIASLAGEFTGIHWLTDVDAFGSMSTTDRVPLAWNADGSALALITVPPHALTPSVSDSAASLSLNITTVDARTGAQRAIGTMTFTDLSSDERVTPRALAWTGDDHVRVERRSSAKSPLIWFVADRDSLRESAMPDTAKLGKQRTPEPQISHPDDRLYETDSSGHERTLFPALNPQLVGIEQPRYLRLRYTGRNGDLLNASALLPYGYTPARRYPTVAYVYGGSMPSAEERFAEPDDDDFINMLVLADHGYVVLQPSLPLPSEDHPGDPMMHLADGLEPAVDTLVRRGIADSTRLGLIGHSYGGYTVQGIITQTKRYKAAVSLAGLSDLVSLYGAFIPELSYMEPNEAASVEAYYLERSAGRVGVPWVHPEQFVRNTPIFFASRITTPLLLMSGDIDDVGQSEEMFAAMYRLGRRAELVRYVGENHYIQSPANVLDMWNRIFRWYDTYLQSAAH